MRPFLARLAREGARAYPKGVDVLYLKTCPKCRGDLATEADAWGRYLFCLQCGWLRDVPMAVGEVAVPAA